jgi:hypothetical protein
MSTRDEFERRINALIAQADWDDLVPRLQAYTRNYLFPGAESRRKRQKIVDLYVLQAVQLVVDRGADYGLWHHWETLFQLLCAVVAHRIDQYRQTVNTIVRESQLEELIPRLILHTVKQYGGRTSRHGRSAEDYVFDAIQALLTGQRYFPYDRVELFTFLCSTIRSLYGHEAEKMAAEGAHFTIVRQSFEDESPMEWNEERLVAPSGDKDDEAALWLARDFLMSIEDPRLREYAKLRALGTYETAREYARALGVTEQTIRNWDRQLKRKRKNWGR